MENQEFIKSFRKDLIRKEEDGTYSIFGWEPFVQMNVWIAFYHPKRNEVRPCHGYFAPHYHGKNLQRKCAKFGITFNNN